MRLCMVGVGLLVCLSHLKYRFWLLRCLSMASREPMPRYFFSRIPSEKKYSPGASVVAARREPIITVNRYNCLEQRFFCFLVFLGVWVGGQAVLGFELGTL
jgi:hypothetical protein